MKTQNDITIVLDRLRSAFNTGNIFRLADAIGAKEVLCCGYTPCPPHLKLVKTAMGADKYVPFRQFDTSLKAIETLRSEGMKKIYAVESLSKGKCPWEFRYDFPCAVVFGNEAFGVSPDIINLCDGIISLPLFGKKSSINVANCAAAVLYAIIARRN